MDTINENGIDYQERSRLQLAILQAVADNLQTKAQILDAHEDQLMSEGCYELAEIILDYMGRVEDEDNAAQDESPLTTGVGEDR